MNHMRDAVIIVKEVKVNTIMKSESKNTTFKQEILQHMRNKRKR